MQVVGLPPVVAHQPPGIESDCLALLQFLPSLPHGNILVRSDSSTAVAYINNQGGTHSQVLSLDTEDLLIWLWHQGCQIEAKFISGASNILADILSREASVSQTEWTLAHAVLGPVWRWFGKPLLDLFATMFSALLPAFVSPVSDPQAVHMGSVAISWAGLVAYAFPSLGMRRKVLLKVRQDGPQLILIAPYWPS